MKNGGVIVATLPENNGWLTLPFAVKVWLCVPNADPVKDPAVSVGTPAGQAFVPAGVKLAVPFVPVAVRVCVCVAKADPVNVSAGTVNELPGETPPIVENAPALVPALLPVTVAIVTVPFVPAGVPALTALVVADEPVNTSAGTVPADPVNPGTPTGHAIVPLATDPDGVPALTALVDCDAVPVNVG